MTGTKPALDSSLHCLCVYRRPCGRRQTLWSEKTTVCRIFNCKRTKPLKRSAAGSWPPASSGTPLARRASLSKLSRSEVVHRSAHLPQPELPILRSARNGRKQNRRKSFNRAASASLTWLAEPELAHGKRRLVENTGLEPVTSWLQTRRSPS